MLARVRGGDSAVGAEDELLVNLGGPGGGLTMSGPTMGSKPGGGVAGTELGILRCGTRGLRSSGLPRAAVELDDCAVLLIGVLDR